MQQKHIKPPIMTDPTPLAETKQPAQSQSQPQPQRIPLVNVNIDSPGVALTLIMQFLNLANNRGAFNLQEASKIYEAIRYLTQQATESDATDTD